MRAVQWVAVALVVAAGLVGVVCVLAVLPLGVEVLPQPVAALVPDRGTGAFTALVVGVIAALVVGGVGAGLAASAVPRRTGR